MGTGVPVLKRGFQCQDHVRDRMVILLLRGGHVDEVGEVDEARVKVYLTDLICSTTGFRMLRVLAARVRGDQEEGSKWEESGV